MTRLVFNADTLGGTTTLSSTDSASSFNLVVPAANGTLATTTNLAAYLALTGGTLTGALIGTTFSGAFNGSIGATTPSTGAFTTLSASGQFTLTNASGYNLYASGAAANVLAGTTHLGGLVGSESLRVTPVASAVNYWVATGAVATGQPVLQPAGSDTNIGTAFATKGTGNHTFYTNGYGSVGFVVAHTASAVNYLQLTGGATGNPVTISAQGSDTNIDFYAAPKGSGYFRIGASVTTTSDAPITGYMTIKDSSGTTRKLAIIA